MKVLVTETAEYTLDLTYEQVENILKEWVRDNGFESIEIENIRVYMEEHTVTINGTIVTTRGE